MLLGLPPSQTPSGKAISVAGRRWDSNSVTRALAAPGQTIEAILTDAVANMRRSGVDRAYSRRMLRYCRCRVNGIEIPREDWSTVCPPEGSRLEFLLAPKGGGGGGGKNRWQWFCHW